MKNFFTQIRIAVALAGSKMDTDLIFIIAVSFLTVVLACAFIILAV